MNAGTEPRAGLCVERRNPTREPVGNHGRRQWWCWLWRVKVLVGTQCVYVEVTAGMARKGGWGIIPGHPSSNG